MKIGGLHAYRILSMDFHWERFVEVDGMLVEADADQRAVSAPGHETYGLSVREFYSFLEHALEAGKAVGWDGDFREQPRVGFLPTQTNQYRFSFGSTTTTVIRLWSRLSNYLILTTRIEPLAARRESKHEGE